MVCPLIEEGQSQYYRHNIAKFLRQEIQVLIIDTIQIANWIPHLYEENVTRRMV